ncbi:MAG: hypothetical protein FWH27_14130 [Planctomycetaceae bacterium]|nr:hypothetical protein [Planctomycetaceae bacterium]
MTINRQSSQPDEIPGIASRHELREAFLSASAKYRREPKRSARETGHSTIHVTCHLCHYTFEYQTLRPVETVSCPSCGVRFELKQKYQIDSVQIEQIEQELARLRAEIEAYHPRRRGLREKSVIGPLPMQTLKKNFDRPDNRQIEKQGKNSKLDSMVRRVRSALVRLENEQLDDYLQWRESLHQHKSHCPEPENNPQETAGELAEDINTDSDTNEYLTDHNENRECVTRSSFAEYSERLRHTKTKFRIKTAVAGIIFCVCVISCATISTMKLLRPDSHSQLALSESSAVAETEVLTPTQIIDVTRQLQSGSDSAGQTSRPDTPPVSPNMIVQAVLPGPVMPETVLDIALPLPPVDSDTDSEREMLALLDQQLQEKQTQLSHITQQYELARQNNEQLERTAKQNEAESFLWEAYSHTEKDPVRSMVLSLQAIERFKELELDIPGTARWVLNQSLASQNLGVPFNGFQGGVDAMTLSKDGQWFLFAGNDGTVWLWDIAQHDQISGSFQLDAINGGVAQLLMTPNIQFGICVGRNGGIRVWNLRLEKPSETPLDIVDSRCHFTNVIVSEDGHWLAAYGKPGRYENNKEANDVYLWDLNQMAHTGISGSPIVLKGHEKPIRSLTINGNSKWLVSGSEDRTVRVYDLKAGYPAAEQIVLKGHELAVNCVAVSPDGHWLVTGGCDSILRIWDMQSPQSMAVSIPLQEHEGWITALAFSPDGKWLASGSYDNTIRLWRMTGVPRPEVAQVLSGHVGRIKSVEFSRQGNLLVSLGSDCEVRLWNLEQGNPSENALAFHCGQIPISSVAMTGDGKWLVLAQQKPNANSSGLRLWPLVFDEAFDFAASFAETRFPSLYQRRQNPASPIPEQQEERIARNGSRTHTGTQFPILSDMQVHVAPTPAMLSEAAFVGGYLLPNTLAAPSGGPINLTHPGINITMPPR